MCGHGFSSTGLGAPENITDHASLVFPRVVVSGMLSRIIREGSPQGRKGDLIPYDRRVKRVVDGKELDTKRLTVSPDPLFK